MPSLQQIEKVAYKLDNHTIYKTLHAQANARYILYGVHEEETNFPTFDPRLTFRIDNIAYICFEVACTYFINRKPDSAMKYFNRGAQFLEYNYANSQCNVPERGFHLIICGLAYYCACQYSKAFVIISKAKCEDYINQIIYAFLSRQFNLLECEIKKVLLDEHIENGITPFDILVARAFSLALNYFYHGNQQHLNEAISTLKDATELAILEEEAETWWLLRLLTIIFDGFYENSLWKNLYDNPLFTVEDVDMKDVCHSISKINRTSGIKDILAQYIHSLAFKRAPITELFVSQRKALEKVLVSGSAVVSMPTSSGKTRIAEIVILQSLLCDISSKVLYIAPFRSLAYEVEEALSSTFNPIGFYVTHLYGGNQITVLDRREMENARVLIATPEKAKAILRINNDEMHGIKLVVMDEGHLIGAHPREIVNEMFTEELRRIVQANGGKFLLLSAVLPNASDMSQWLSGKKENVVYDTGRPSSQRLGLICYKKNRLDIEWKGDVRCFNSGFVKAKGDKKKLVAKAAIKLSEMGSVMIYVSKKNWIMSHARTMYNLIKNEYDVDWGNDDLDWKKFNLVCQESKEDQEYIELAKKGILCHSASLKADVRRYMERLLRKGKARFIYATNTLAQGVNLGVSTLIVTNVVLGKDVSLNTNDFWNMAGRAGRSYIDTEGKILFVCDCTQNEQKNRRRAETYLDKISTDNAISGVYTYLKKLCILHKTIGMDFDHLLELITENQLDQIPPKKNDISWGEFFELIDDSLLTLDIAYRDNENDDAQWVDYHFKDSLSVIQEQDEALKSKHLNILKARVHAIRKITKGNTLPHGFASSGIPLKVALYLDEKSNELLNIANEYLGSSQTLDDKLNFFYLFDKIIQEIQSKRVVVPKMKELDNIRKAWITGEPMDNEENILAEGYYGNTISWLMNAIVSRFDNEGEEQLKECYEEMSLIAAYGVPSKWAAQIYLCGINSRSVATELSKVLIAPNNTHSRSSVTIYLRNNADKLINGEICSELAKAWLEVLKTRPKSIIKEITSIKGFDFGKKSQEEVPVLLLCKKVAEKIYLCSVDLKYKRCMNDIDYLPFSDIADISGVFFIREGDLWKMKNVNPFVTIVDEDVNRCDLK